MYTFRDLCEKNFLNRNRYEMLSANESNIIIFEEDIGRYWRKFISSNKDPTDWTEEMVDFLN